MEYKVFDDRIKVIDNDLIPKNAMVLVIDTIKEENPYHSVVINRNEKSMYYEMCVHKFLYKLGVAKSRTKDCDLEYPQKWYYKIGYNILGFLCQPFIK